MKIFNKVTNWTAPESNRVWLSLTQNSDGSAELIISGQIGKNWWDDSGVSGKEFRDALNQIPKGSKISVRINSEGGSVQDGLEMYNAIKERSADVTAHISGYAVSIASVIPLAASRIISPISSVWMVHEPWSVTQGNAEDHQKSAEMLNKHGDMLAQIYAEETGNSKRIMRDAMKKETWFTGSEAVEFGLADETEPDDDDVTNNLKRFDIAAFKKLPKPIFNMISAVIGGQPKPQNEQEHKMKKTLVALLNQHGIKDAAGKAFTNDSPDAEVESAAAQIKTAPASNGNTIDLQAELALIKRNRISDKVDGFITDQKITKAEKPIWVEAMLKDESGTVAILDGKPAQSPGGIAAGLDITFIEPEAHPVLAANGRSSEMLLNIAKTNNNDKAKTYAAMKAEWPNLTRDAARRDKAKNENTFSANLTTNFLILGATTQISPKFASVRMFSRDTSVDPFKPLATGEMKFNVTAQDGSTTLTNATNFESGDSTLNAVAITVAQYTEPFHITNAHLNNGIRMEDLVHAKLASLGSKVSKILAANITAANFTATPLISAPAAFGFSDMATLWGQLQKASRKNIMLDGTYMSRIINTPTLFQSVPVVPGAGWANVNGWDYLALHTEWSAAGNNIKGFACDPQALGVIAGLPLVDSPAIPGGILAQASGILPGVDLAIAVYAWFNTATRTYWASYDLMFGANALDTTAGVVIATGTPS